MEVAGQVRSIQLESSVSMKRRKVDSVEPILLPKSSISNGPLPNQCCLSCPDSSKNSVSPTTTFEFPDQIPLTSLCSKNQSTTNSSSTLSDVKADENCGTHDISVSPSHGFSSDKKKEEVMESPTINKKRKISQASSVDAVKMPSTEEIDEFFSVAEKFEMKRFMEKYNYDTVKDVALEGRYQWVCLKP
ncbi:uncharacterized protein LOC141668120 isoform X1 [Apium graveolens]|uniref:uncharacterized protein LOC141668120 isoform X1 n=1 Tax=Apium graveolens TaxID=4045 RepID=UPI003D7A5810